MDAGSCIIDGKSIGDNLRSKLKAEIARIQAVMPAFKPGLAIVQVGNREDSNVYVGTKVKTAMEIGMHAVHLKLPDTITEAELLNQIRELNDDPSIHGIIVQLPLDAKNNIDTTYCTNTVSVEKDVDGLCDVNAGRLARGGINCFVPCTPAGCMELMRSVGYDVRGKNAVVVGRSKIVGSPMANLLTWADATVTVCHSKTKDLESHIRAADIVVAACGSAGLIKGDWVRLGAMVIDCGINVIPDETRKTGRRLVGDVEFDSAKTRAGWITPVPGGVGPMTVAFLMRNTVLSAKRYFGIVDTDQ